jgi:hypothetical protein
MDLAIIFEKLKALLQKYENSFVTQVNTSTNYALWSRKGINKGAGAKLYEKFFAGVTIRKNYVAFYLMAMYKSKLKEAIDPELVNHLNGKYGFQIRTWDANLERQIIKALELGYQYFQEKDWI